MAGHTQKNKSVQVKLPFEADYVQFSSIKGTEELSGMFEYTLELLNTSEEEELDFNDLLGMPVTVGMQRPDMEVRYFNGVLTHFRHLGYRDEYSVVEVVLRPWLWFLTQTRDSQIYQNLTIPDIICQKFDSLGFSNYELRIKSSNYSEWNFCTQYQETDYDFVNRLLEKEGIYYYFEHEDGKHTMVLCDKVGHHDYVSGYTDVPFYPESDNQIRDEDHFSEWKIDAQVVTDTVMLNDYGFLDPIGAKTNALMVEHTISPSETGSALHNGSPLHIAYDCSSDYPYDDKGKKSLPYAERIVKARAEAYRAQHERVLGEGVVHGIGAGILFNLTGYNREDQNREYLIVKYTFEFSLGSNKAGDANEAVPFHCTVNCLPSNVQFRPMLKTPKPVMQGVQTATVVGKEGEEIYTDKHGRVKLFFHWDFRSPCDETSSCWVRVSQAWAGSGYGSLHLPRINNEVLVEFINGDPDQPIVTGRVYNGENETPYKLPAKATQSGFKSRSTKGGGTKNFNEIRMEDKKGKEELYFHAEKNMTENVENDHSVSIGHDRSETIKNDKTLTVDGKHTETIKKDHKVRVVEGNSDYQVVKGGAVMYAEKDFNIVTGKDMFLLSTNNMDATSQKNMNLAAAENISIGSENKQIEITAKTKIVLTSGDSSITLAKDGTITIKGKNVNIDSDMLKADGGNGVEITGSEVKIN